MKADEADKILAAMADEMTGALFGVKVSAPMANVLVKCIFEVDAARDALRDRIADNPPLTLYKLCKYKRWNVSRSEIDEVNAGSEPCDICAKASDTPCEYCDPKWRGAKWGV